jgi:hypothetical protein
MPQFEDDLAKELADLIRQHVAIVTKPLELRIVQLEKQAADFKYCGVWHYGESYRKHNFCTYDGSIWICLRDTAAKSGQSPDWQLAVQKGRDARTERKPAA